MQNIFLKLVLLAETNVLSSSLSDNNDYLMPTTSSNDKVLQRRNNICYEKKSDSDELTDEADNILDESSKKDPDLSKYIPDKINFKSNVIFHFIEKALVYILYNKEEITAVLYQLNFLLETKRAPVVFSFFHYTYGYFCSERIYNAKLYLDGIDENELVNSTVQTKTAIDFLNTLLYIANKHPENYEDTNYRTLKKRVLKVYPDLDEHRLSYLSSSCNITKQLYEEQAVQLEIKEPNLAVFLGLIRIISDLTASINYVFVTIDESYLYNRLNEYSGLTKIINPELTEENSLFMFCIEVILYLYEINFFPGSVLEKNKRNIISSTEIIDVVKFINILHLMIIKKEYDNEFVLSRTAIKHIESEIIKIIDTPKNRDAIVNNFVRFYRVVDMRINNSVEEKFIVSIVRRYLDITIGMFNLPLEMLNNF